MSILQRMCHSLTGLRREDIAQIAVLDACAGPVYAVGDVHGCLSLYTKLETIILRDSQQFAGSPTIVLLGDMIDRGNQTAAMIDHLLAPLAGTARRLCLMGNHEAMMLAYLANPCANANWLYSGGFETLLSYGLGIDLATIEKMNERKLQQALCAHLPAHHLRFLENLIHGLQVGPYFLAHAGAESTAPLNAQRLQALIWGGPRRKAPEGLTLIHGHFVTASPDCQPHSIGIDTGAYATGRLTALRLINGRPPAVLTLRDDSAFRDLVAYG